MSEPGSRDADRWGEAVAELARRVQEAQGSLLALVVGPSDAARLAFTADLSAALPVGYEVRSQRIDEAAPNPLAAVQDDGGVERVVFIAYGLSDLSEERRRESLRLMNWSRGQLSRRPVRLVLWVEPPIVRDLYTYAGDFADWWAVLLELPEPPERPQPDAGPRPDRWALLDRLILLIEEDERLRSAGGSSDRKEIKDLTEALCVELRPGQIVAGARLVERRDRGLWLAHSLEGKRELLVHALEGLRLDTAWDLDIGTLRCFQADASRFSERQHASWIAGIPQLVARDEHVLAFATSAPAGSPLGGAILSQGWSIQTRAELFFRCCELAEALLKSGWFLVRLKVQDVWVDADGAPALVTLWGAEGEPRSLARVPRFTQGGLPAAPELESRAPTQETMVVFTLGALLAFMLTGKVDSIGLRARGWLDEIGAEDLTACALADVARRAISHAPADRYPSIGALRHATRAALESGRASRSSQVWSTSAGAASSTLRPEAGPRPLSAVWLGLLGGLLGAAGPALLMIRQTQELRDLRRDVQATSAELQRTRAELEAMRGEPREPSKRPEQPPDLEPVPRDDLRDP